MQTLNSIFWSVEKATDQSTDPLNKFEFDPTQEAHVKLQQDFRQGMVSLLASCHPLCIKDTQNSSLSKKERVCLEQCVESHVLSARKLFKECSTTKKEI